MRQKKTVILSINKGIPEWLPCHDNIRLQLPWFGTHAAIESAFLLFQISLFAKKMLAANLVSSRTMLTANI